MITRPATFGSGRAGTVTLAVGLTVRMRCATAVEVAKTFVRRVDGTKFIGG